MRSTTYRALQILGSASQPMLAKAFAKQMWPDTTGREPGGGFGTGMVVVSNTQRATVFLNLLNRHGYVKATGVRGQPYSYSLTEQGEAALKESPKTRTVWCVKHDDRWCVCLFNRKFDDTRSTIPTLCDRQHKPEGREKRYPTCPDCVELLEAKWLRRGR